MKKRKIVEGVEIVDIGAKGKVIGKKEGVAYLTSDAVPGDVVTIEVRRNKKGFKQGRMVELESKSPDRTEPVCQHFDYCGGCSWQNLIYSKQIELKAERVTQQIRRIGGLTDFEVLPIKGNPDQFAYRNKLEFTFVHERWLTPEEIKEDKVIKKGPALGFHVPGRFDWVLHIEECHLLDPYHNQIRNFVFEEGVKRGISFYKPREKEGTLRNLVLRLNRQGHWMILLVVSEPTEAVSALCDVMIKEFPLIQSLWLIVNEKVNDIYSDCPATLIRGESHLIEQFTRPDGSTVQFKIGPKSFFQTNTDQAERLYQNIYEWANISSEDVVYDLYTGTGSIALFVAPHAQKVIGVEYVPESIEDAQTNAELNGIDNCAFFAGDMKDVLTEDFIATQGKPDVLIADPPRAGMHADVIERINAAAPKRIVYVSCDPATQARDLKLLSEKYDLIKIQPVDMFPHTSHIENIALLELRN